ncbi:MAG: hypothetical protein GXY22_04360, partial [Clostridiaceae bacterium]|nr:hypothetical protein [Clostridiaceae bacterium]
MKSMHIRLAYRYKMNALLISTAIFTTVMALLLTALIAGTLRINLSIDGNVRSSFSGYGFAAAIFVFITGIVSIREDFRLFMQYGVTRKTTYLVQILAAGSVAIILALLGELLLKMSQLAVGTDSRLVISDLYYLIFADKNRFRPMIIQHLESIATYISLFICAYSAGAFISLLFYRLNKIWTVIVAVGAPILILVGLPILVSRLNINLDRPVLFVTSQPWLFIALFCTVAVVFNIVNWLLLRRAPV